MHPYPDAPYLMEESVASRTRLLTRTIVKALRGPHREQIQRHTAGMIEDALEGERYELAQALINASKQFAANPQLSFL